MAKDMRYTNGRQVMPVIWKNENKDELWCPANVKGLRQPNKEYKDDDVENRLPVSCLFDEDVEDSKGRHGNFSWVYDNWIKPALKHMTKTRESYRERHKECTGEITPLSGSLFNQDANEADCQIFAEEFAKWIKGLEEYNDIPVCVHAMCQTDAIIRNVDRDLEGVNAGLRLRVKVMCMLLNALPDYAFDEEIGWKNEFEEDTSMEYVDVHDGDTYPLKLEAGEKLYPATLRNDSSETCQINVKYEGKTFQITMAPHGFLRVIFADQEYSQLVSIKGNISFCKDSCNAVLQMPTEGSPALKLLHKSSRVPDEISLGGLFEDAAADGGVGAVKITRKGLYFISNGKYESEYPIRVYGAGSLWAWQYADGSLKTNLKKANGEKFTRAIAIVENGDEALLLHDGENAWYCVKGYAWKFSEKYHSDNSDRKFVECMMSRFGQPGICECVEGTYQTLQILDNGELEVV